jgi:micrococcal nuclease
MTNLYYYKANVIKVYDGDTVTVDIDLGMGVWLHKKNIRLFGIDAPEMRGPEKEEGKKSRDWLREKILGKEIILKTVKDKTGKYGRIIGEIWFEHENINDLLVENGLAKTAVY